MHLLRILAAAAILLFASPALFAATLETRVPLRDGRLSSADLTQALLENAHIKGVELDVGSIDMRGLEGTTFIHALNTALGGGCRIEVTPDALVLHIDTDKLPHSMTQAKRDIRVFTAEAAPDATARQRRNFGILLPQHVNPNRPLVVLVHGLDCNKFNWYPMADLLAGEGYQIGYFCYPSDGPLEDDAALLADQMTALREDFPTTKIDVVAHSMGCLVARRYVEGDAYAGGVDHFILLGPPNLGSRWAACRMALEIQEHYKLWKYDKDWSPTWSITDGLGEAADDLKPSSKFLQHLNSLPRREGVRYTIVAGDQNPIYPITANALDSAAHWIPQRAQTWWGLRQTENALLNAADDARHHTGKSDGPVSVASTQLPGVEDYVLLPATHMGLMYPIDGQRPAAWDVVRDRLSQ
jgi:pimeloyl-ACP methyl ester carboxylesterase